MGSHSVTCHPTQVTPPVGRYSIGKGKERRREDKGGRAKQKGSKEREEEQRCQGWGGGRAGWGRRRDREGMGNLAPTVISRSRSLWTPSNQTVNDGVAHSKNPKKCAYHVTFNLDLEHTLNACLPGDHRVHVWWRPGQLSVRRSDLRKILQTDRRTDRQTDRRRTPRHCISSFLE